MGYLKAWKRNLVTLILILAAAGAFVGFVAWRRGTLFKSGPGQHAAKVHLSVGGSAPGGVVVVYSDQTGPYTIAHHAVPPFSGSLPIDGRIGQYGAWAYFAELDVTPRESGSLVCTIRVGSAKRVDHSSGHKACAVHLIYDPRTGTWY